MDELLEQFLVEGRELAMEAEAALALLAVEPTDQAALDRAFRAFHTLKGSVAIFDMAPAERLLHVAEDSLAAARGGTHPLEGGQIRVLLACIDQAQRWIDEMETGIGLGAGAADLTDALIERLVSRPFPATETAVVPPAPAPAPAPEPEPEPWLDALRDREREALDSTDKSLIAFRYVPDEDCFFRGEDPLAAVAAIPGLVRLDVQPAGVWPPLADWLPFRCTAVLEGLIDASLDTVRAAFRLMPDQVELSTIAPSARGVADETAASSAQADQTLRVAADRIDAIANGIGELLVATNALSHGAMRAEAIDPALGAAIRATQADIERVAADLHRNLSSMRRVPLAASLQRLPRLVREIAETLGKQVRFEMSGQTMEVDKQVADALFEPLLHLVRNALDHGIEPPAARSSAGKPPEGTLRLVVWREGEDVVISLADDGAGIDPAHIRAIAAERGLLSPVAAAELDDQQAIRLIFTPGFSTAARVTDLSGRGVGMDVVKTAIGRLRGRIDVEARPGEGTQFRLRLPLNAITTRLLVVHVGEDRFGVPLDQIVETVAIPEDRIVPLGAGEACVVRDRTVPVLHLGTLLGMPAERTQIARLVVTEARSTPVAIRIDAFGDRFDGLVRERRGLLANVPGIAGTTLLGDGGVLLVLNLEELVG
ncbi:two-component system chemotaxis sensor kinase CheA [Sphingomonas zeicaulis]|uniref:chemotaxis protein CheA n=1 Tax=Sphingomonas zeicaulis TaxID=1632740 RepID=UPI003D234777